MIELYAKRMRPGEWIAYEKHPVPGGKDMAVLSRRTRRLALSDAREYIDKQHGGSCFKAERSVVGSS